MSWGSGLWSRHPLQNMSAARTTVIEALKAELHPARVLLVAEPFIGPPAVVVLQPPSVLLQGTIAAHILTALDSARSSAAADCASGAKAR